MNVAPLQIYSSALIFAPTNCEFRRCFKEMIPKWIKHQPTVPMDWDLCEQTLEGHRAAIDQAVLSPDSSLIASRSQNKVLIWRSHTGTCIHEIDVDARTEQMTFSCDSKLFYLVLSNCKVETWETDTWTCKTTIKAGTVAGSALYRATAISHDCKLVAVGSIKRIEIRSIATPGDSVKTIKTHRSRRFSLIFSPDSTYIAALFSDPTSLQVWPVHGGEPIKIEYCLAAAYSADSSLMALAFENVIEMRRIDKGSLNFHQKFSLGDKYPLSLTLSHDASLLAIGFKSNKLGIWLTDTGECIWTANDHTNVISSLSFSQDSTFLVSSSRDGTMRIYSVGKHQSPEVHERKLEQVGPITVSSDSSLILLEPDPGNSIWQILRVDTGACIRELDRDKLQCEPTFTQDSALAIIQGGAVEIWHPDRCRSVQNLDGLGSDPSAIPAACFSADFTLAAGILDDRSLQIWQVNTGVCMRAVKSAMPKSYFPETLTLCFSPDASRIACTSERKKEVFVWQIASDLPAQNFDLSENVDCFALSNTKLAAASDSLGFRIWSLETGDLLQHLRKSGLYLRRLAFSYDSALLASTRHYTSEKAIQIWNANTSAHVQVINVGLEITHISFEPNSNSRLCTNLGRIKSKASPTSLGEDAAGVGQTQLWYYDELGFDNDDQHDYGTWITFNGEKLLWLPAKYRGRWETSRAVSESVAAIGSKYLEQFAIIGFDTEKVPKWYHDMHKYFESRRAIDKDL